MNAYAETATNQINNTKSILEIIKKHDKNLKPTGSIIAFSSKPTQAIAEITRLLQPLQQKHKIQINISVVKNSKDAVQMIVKDASGQPVTSITLLKEIHDKVAKISGVTSVHIQRLQLKKSS